MRCARCRRQVNVLVWREGLTRMRKNLPIVLHFLALFGGWLLWVRDWYQSVTPAGSGLADHLEQRPPAMWRRVVVVAGQEHLLLFGPWQMFPRYPSGPPVCVFDPAGRLVDWTPDEGDDEAFNERWPGLFAGRELTPEQVAAWPGATR